MYIQWKTNQKFYISLAIPFFTLEFSFYHFLSIFLINRIIEVQRGGADLERRLGEVGAFAPVGCGRGGVPGGGTLKPSSEK